MGIAISNVGKPIASWEWRLGFLINGNKPLRPMDNPSDPALAHPQPVAHGRVPGPPPGVLPAQSNDHGFVHRNSGIHNKAAFTLLTNGAWPRTMWPSFST